MAQTRGSILKSHDATSLVTQLTGAGMVGIIGGLVGAALIAFTPSPEKAMAGGLLSPESIRSSGLGAALVVSAVPEETATTGATAAEEEKVDIVIEELVIYADPDPVTESDSTAPAVTEIGVFHGAIMPPDTTRELTAVLMATGDTAAAFRAPIDAEGSFAMRAVRAGCYQLAVVDADGTELELGSIGDVCVPAGGPAFLAVLIHD